MTDWKMVIDISDFWYDKMMLRETKAQLIVDRFKAHERLIKNTLKDEWDYLDLEDLLDEMADCGGNSTEEFNSIWSAIYDWADEDHRIWIRR